MAWPVHRTGGWKPTGLRPGQGPGGTMQKLQEPPGKTGGRAPFHLLVFCRCCSRQNHGETILRVCVIVLCCSCVGPMLTFCVVCRCLQHVLRVMCVRCLRVCVRLRDCGGDRMCAERVGRQGLPVGGGGGPPVGGGGEEGLVLDTGCGGSEEGAWVSLRLTAALCSSAVVPQGPHGDSGQATPMAQPDLTCQCGNLSTQDCGPARPGCSQGESTREASDRPCPSPCRLWLWAGCFPVCERRVQPSCCLGAGKVISGPQAQMVLLRRVPGHCLEQTRLPPSPLGPPGLAPSDTLPFDNPSFL